MNNSHICFNVFSGTFCNLLEEDLKNIGLGYLPLKKNSSKNCNKCYGRGFRGMQTENFTHTPCSCVQKNLNLDILKEIENKYIKLFEQLSGSNTQTTAN